MSKTYNNCIYLSDSPEVIEKKLASMITDPHRKYRQDKGHPQECPVFFYHTIFNLDISSTIEKQCRQAQIGCVDCKKALSNKLVAFLRPIYDKRLELREDMEAIRKIIARGSEKAQEVASQTIKEVKAALRL